MPETPAHEQDQSTVPEAPEEAQDQPNGNEESFTDSYNPNEVPEEARPALEAAYKQLQADYTKKTQDLAGERQKAEGAAQAQQIVEALANPETAPEVLRYFGLELADEEEDPFDQDPEDRIAEVEQRFASFQQEQQALMQEAAETEAIADQIEALEEAEGRQFDAAEIKILVNEARNNPDGQGQPDVRGAYDTLSGLYRERQNAWLNTKKRSPRSPSSGTPASKATDLKSEAGRIQAAAAAAEAALASE